MAEICGPWYGIPCRLPVRNPVLGKHANPPLPSTESRTRENEFDRAALSAADRVAKHRPLADAGLVELGPMKANEVGLQELLIAWRILAPALYRENYTPAELTAGTEQLLAKHIAELEAESSAGMTRRCPSKPTG